MSSQPTPTLCFHCGQSAGEPLRLNRLDDGRICPSCADRVLVALPPVLPALVPAPGTERPLESEGAAEGGFEPPSVDLGGPDFDLPA